MMLDGNTRKILIAFLVIVSLVLLAIFVRDSYFTSEHTEFRERIHQQ